jgi:imidazole glycerol phosphate synthase glutamine amidotransferase subunit
MIAILNYGAGNLRSVQNTLDELGAKHTVVRESDGLRRAERLILPGVGHFGQMLRALNKLRVRDALVERIRAGMPFLGICLGLQALFESSEEAPEQKGLALFPGVVRRFPAEARVPHMGWNELEPRAESKLLEGIPRPLYVYFAHSYYAPEVAATAAACTYVVPYTAALECGNIFGVQFHPEKSGPVGLRIMKNFLAA